MEKEWKIKYGFSCYRISNFGDVELISKNILMKPKIDNNGFYRLSIYGDDNRISNLWIHRLVSELFMENPDKIGKIKHIDGNKLNNKLSNLIFAYPSTFSEDIPEIVYLPSEKWLEIPDYPMYEISNFGRVKSLSYGGSGVPGLLSQHLDRYGYYKVCLSSNGSNIIKSVHQLVVMAFFNHKPDGTLKLVVNHIDCDKTNNNIDNLEVISARRNVIHSNKRIKSKTNGLYSSIVLG